jgi:hypothetical protein
VIPRTSMFIASTCQTGKPCLVSLLLWGYLAAVPLGLWNAATDALIAHSGKAVPCRRHPPDIHIVHSYVTSAVTVKAFVGSKSRTVNHPPHWCEIIGCITELQQMWLQDHPLSGRSPWWWRQQGPTKRWWTSTRLHGAATQKTAFFVLTAVRTSNLTKIC